jgi:hypothetical protein
LVWDNGLRVLGEMNDLGQAHEQIVRDGGPEINLF